MMPPRPGDAIRAQLDADLNGTSLDDAPYLAVRYGDALRAALEVPDCRDTGHSEMIRRVIAYVLDVSPD